MSFEGGHNNLGNDHIAYPLESRHSVSSALQPPWERLLSSYTKSHSENGIASNGPVLMAQSQSIRPDTRTAYKYLPLEITSLTGARKQQRGDASKMQRENLVVSSTPTIGTKDRVAGFFT